MKMIIIGHVFMCGEGKNKFCVWCEEEQNLVLNNKNDQLLSLFLCYDCYLRMNCTVLYKLLT